MGCAAPVGATIDLPAITAAPSTPAMDGGAGYAGTVAWSSRDPSPVVVSSEVLAPAVGNNSVRLFANYAIAGTPVFTTGYTMAPFLMGHMKIQYGTGAAQRVLYTDVAPGSVQLPPCTFVQVSARRRNPTGAPLNLTGDYRLNVSVSPGVVHPDTPLPRCTAELGTFDANTAGVKPVQVPPSAVEMEVELVDTGGGSLPPFGAQVAYGQELYVDYSVPFSWPSYRRVPINVAGTINVTPAAAAAQTMNAVLSFLVVP